MASNMFNTQPIITQPYDIINIGINPNSYKITEDVVMIYGDYIMKTVISNCRLSFNYSYSMSESIRSFTELFKVCLKQLNYKISQKLFDHCITVWTFYQDKNVAVTGFKIDIIGNIIDIMRVNDELLTLNNIKSLFKINVLKKNMMLHKIIKKYKKKDTVIFSKEDLMLAIKYNDILNSYSLSNTLIELSPFCKNPSAKLLLFVFKRINDILDLMQTDKNINYYVVFSNNIIPCIYDYICVVDCDLDKDIYDKYNQLLDKIISIYLHKEKFKQNLIEYNQIIILNNNYKFDVNNLKELLKLHQCINPINAIKTMMNKYKITPDEECITISCETNPEALMIFTEHSEITNEKAITLIKTLVDNIKEHQRGYFNYTSYVKLLKLLITNRIHPTFELLDVILDTGFYTLELVNVIVEYIDNGYTPTQYEFNHIVKRIILIPFYDSLKLTKYILTIFQDLKLKKEMLHFIEKDKCNTTINTTLLRYIYENIEIGQDELYCMFLKNVTIDIINQVVFKNNLTIDRNCLRNACVVDRTPIITFIIDHDILPDFECIDNICKTIGNIKYILNWIEKELIQLSIQNLKDLVSNMEPKEMKLKTMKILIENTF